MHLLSASGVFLATFLLSFFWSFEKDTPKESQRCLAGIFNSTNCRSVVGKSTFDKEEFKKLLEQYKNKKGSFEEREILEIIKNPESLLAALEALSQVENYQGLDFSNRLNDLSDKELKKIYKTLSTTKKSDQISLYHFKKLIIKIYRLTHGQPRFLSSFWKHKSFNSAIAKLQDYKIQERLELELLNEGLESTFSVVIKEPSLRVKFLELVSANTGWIDSALVFSLWSATSLFAPPGTETLTNIINKAPPLLPSFEQFLKTEVTAENLKVLKEKGLQAGVESLKLSEEKKLNLKKNWGYLRAVYTSVFTVLMTVSLHQEIQSLQSKMIIESLTGKIVERNKVEQMPLEQRFEILDWRPYMEELRKVGNTMDENSEPIQRLKAERRKTFVEAMESQKKAQR
ncbi:MAG: hypothetical protein ACK5W9_14210 [Bdellovibrionales bacterium]